MSETQLRELNNESIKTLEPICSKLELLIKKLNPLLSQSLMNELKETRNLAKTALDQNNKLESEYQNKVFAALDKIVEENNFISVWSISEVAPEDFDKPFSNKPVKSISYNGNSVSFPAIGKNITWLEAWKHADQLIQESEDEQHIFIEDFTEDNDNSGHFLVTTGS